MNSVRILLLHLASFAAIVTGGSMLYDSYQDFSWSRRTLAETNPNDWVRRGAIAEESTKKSNEGSAALSMGLLLVSAGLLMDGLSSILKRLPRIPLAEEPRKAWHRFSFSKPRLEHPLVAQSVKTRQEVV